MKQQSNPLDLQEQTAPEMPLQGKHTKKRLPWYLLPLLCFLLCFGVWVAMMLLAAQIEQETMELDRWCKDPENVQQYESAMEQNEKSQQIKEELTELQQLEEILAQYPRLDEAQIKGILAVGGDAVENHILGYQAHQGELILQAVSNDPIDPDSYQSLLEQSGYIQSVQERRSTFRQDQYVLELRLVLKPGNAQ